MFKHVVSGLSLEADLLAQWCLTHWMDPNEWWGWCRHCMNVKMARCVYGWNNNEKKEEQRLTAVRLRRRRREKRMMMMLLYWLSSWLRMYRKQGKLIGDWSYWYLFSFEGIRFLTDSCNQRFVAYREKSSTKKARREESSHLIPLSFSFRLIETDFRRKNFTQRFSYGSCYGKPAFKQTLLFFSLLLIFTFPMWRSQTHDKIVTSEPVDAVWDNTTSV